MPTIDLQTAVAKIYQIVDQRRNRGMSSPFFFIVGGGVSNPPIPLAREIEEHCRKEAERYGDTTLPTSTRAIDSYSHWFSKAYPSAEELQRYLRGLMEKLPVSKANLRLAHLVLDGTVARTVFTPNFDDMLTKALELFGQRALVCDHPLTVTRMSIDSRDIQIIHVHGSYWFYDCCNLTQDITDRSGNAPMSVMLDQSLRAHSPLVVGYSGWEGDILMASLKRRLGSGKLGTPIYWFCYQKDAMAFLPDWLIEHNDVQFVLPDESSLTTVASAVVDSLESVSEDAPRLTITGGTEESSSNPPKAVLPADRVFDALVRHFKLAAPPLTVNPLSFYAAQLRGFLGPNDPNDAEPDSYYSFHTVISRVERARDAEAAEPPDVLQGFRDAMSKADYRGAITLASQIDLNMLSADGRREVVFVLMDACLGLNDNSAEEIAGYDLIVRVGDLLAEDGPIDLRVQEQVANALGNKGLSLGTLDRNEEAIAVYEDVVRRFGDVQESALREQVANALGNKGFRLGALNRNEEAIATYDDLVRRFADAQEPALRASVAKALRNKGYSLGKLNRNEEAIASYEDLVRRFADAQEPAIREQVSTALLNKGIRLGALNRNEEAIAAYDDLVRRFAEAPESAPGASVAKALRNKGYSLGVLNRNEEAIAAYDDLVRRFAEAPEPAVREQVAKALLSRGITLGSLNRSEEEIDTYDDLVRRFADAQEPAIREQVAKALLNKGIALGTLNRSREEIDTYDDLVRRLAEAQEPAIREQVAKALLNKGIALGTLNSSEEEIDTYHDLVRRFAEAQEPAIREQVANALVNKGLTYESLDRRDAAITTYHEVVTRFADSPEAAISERVATARSRLDDLSGGDATSG